MEHALDVIGLGVVDNSGSQLVDGVDLCVQRGRMTALVGESGSGKTMTALAVLGLLPAGVSRNAGSIRILGQDVGKDHQLHRSMLGRDIAMVFQEPMTALNPVMRIDAQLIEARSRRMKQGGQRSQAWCMAALEAVGLERPDVVARQFPHELSGGMRQRVLLAMGLAPEPALLLADEPTTALDAVNRREALDLLGAAARGGAGVLLITHDLGSVRGWADRVVVMRSGRVCEQGEADEVLTSPQHPYTQGLLACVPRPGIRGDLPEIQPHL